MLAIRPFQETDGDYAAWIDLSTAIDPEVHLTIELLREEQLEFATDNRVARILGELDNKVVAYGLFWHPLCNKNKPYSFSFSMHPDHISGCEPAQMHDFLLSQIEAEQPAAIASSVTEDRLHRIHLLEASGFKPQMRFPQSRLEVSRVCVEDYETQITRLAGNGIDFVTLTDAIKQDTNWERNVWQMFSVIERDIPDPEPFEPTPFEEYAEYYAGKWFRPDSWSIAVDSSLQGAERYVGMSVVNIMPTKPKSLFAGITGVVPTHRRRQIATVLKVFSAVYAQQNGYQFIETDNEENNPMYDLNMKLGFEPLPASVYYRKEMQ